MVCRCDLSMEGIGTGAQVRDFAAVGVVLVQRQMDKGRNRAVTQNP